MIINSYYDPANHNQTRIDKQISNLCGLYFIEKVVTDGTDTTTNTVEIEEEVGI
jgi:hypothetical protein